LTALEEILSAHRGELLFFNGRGVDKGEHLVGKLAADGDIIKNWPIALVKKCSRERHGST